MTEQEAARTGHSASDVLESEAYQSAMASLKAQVALQWRESPIRDAEGALLLLQLAKLTEKFDAILRGYVEGGKLAQHRIDLDAMRNESGAKRLMRRVL